METIFDDDYFDNLPDDKIEALRDVCNVFLEFHHNVPAKEEIVHYNAYCDAYFGIKIYMEHLDIKFELSSVSLMRTDDRASDIVQIVKFFVTLRTRLQEIFDQNLIESLEFKYKSKFNKVFHYKFSDGDIARIQTLINELRDYISVSKYFKDDHKFRLLKRLELLQLELHKRMSNLDRFWGLVGETGMALGKFGNDIKPMVDRVKEIYEIMWRSQTVANELPSSFSMPMLGNADSE